MIKLDEPEPLGGGFFANRKSYIQSGLANEFFYGWGNEDGERVNQWTNLGFRFSKIEGNIYHLSHQRNMNSTYHSKKQPELKNAELERLAMMSKMELTKEINGWD